MMIFFIDGDDDDIFFVTDPDQWKPHQTDTWTVNGETLKKSINFISWEGEGGEGRITDSNCRYAMNFVRVPTDMFLGAHCTVKKADAR